MKILEIQLQNFVKTALPVLKTPKFVHTILLNFNNQKFIRAESQCKLHCAMKKCEKVIFECSRKPSFIERCIFANTIKYNLYHINVLYNKYYQLVKANSFRLPERIINSIFKKKFKLRFLNSFQFELCTSSSDEFDTSNNFLTLLSFSVRQRILLIKV